MSKHRESLLDLAVESSSSDDDGDFFIGASEIIYMYYQSSSKPKHGGKFREGRIFFPDSVYN
jgi:hypothetical protein